MMLWKSRKKSMKTQKIHLLPAVGNGNYIVTMRLTKDLPNYMPIYGRRVCLEHKGIRRQCNWCYGYHLRKFCKYEKMGLEEYAEKFRLFHPRIPEPYYGRLAKTPNPGNAEVTAVTAAQILPVPTVLPEIVLDNVASDKPLKLSFRRNSGKEDSWTMVGKPDRLGQISESTVSKVSSAQGSSRMESTATLSVASTTRMAGNAMNEKLNVLRATFKQPAATDTPASSNLAPPKVNPVEANPVSRSSSASRGRGLARNQKN